MSAWFICKSVSLYGNQKLNTNCHCYVECMISHVSTVITRYLFKVINVRDVCVWIYVMCNKIIPRKVPAIWTRILKFFCHFFLRLIWRLCELCRLVIFLSCSPKFFIQSCHDVFYINNYILINSWQSCICRTENYSSWGKPLENLQENILLV